MNTQVIVSRIKDLVLQKISDMSEREGLDFNGSKQKFQLEVISFVVYLTLDYIKRAFYQINPALAATVIKDRPISIKNYTPMEELIYEKILTIAERESLENDLEKTLLKELTDSIIFLVLDHMEKIFIQVDADLANQIICLARAQIESTKRWEQEVA